MSTFDATGNPVPAVKGKSELTTGTIDIEAIDTANALKVGIVDASGDQITSFGGGTQYTEDAAAAANPVGNASILIRTDTPATQTTTDGDNVAQRGTNYGAAYVQLVTSSGSYIDSVGGGTQYTEGDTDASITGTAVMWEDTSDTLRSVSASKPLPVNLQNSDTVSTNNSTTSVLSGGAAFTGTGDDCLGYTSVTIILKASHDSAASGMSFQFSTDNSNWDDVYNFTYTATAARRFQFPVNARYFRVVYTNGGTLQTSFRVQTILHRQNVLTSIHRVDDVLGTDRSAQLVKSVMVGKINEQFAISSATEGQYDNISLTQWRELRTRDQRAADLQPCNDSTSVTVLGNDTTNLANSLNHVFGTAAITFDKANGAANTVFAGVQDTITSIDISEIFEDGAFAALSCYLPSLTNVVAVFLRIGTDSSNYNEWEWPVNDLDASVWMSLRRPLSQPSGFAGNGWDTNAVTYVAFGVEFSLETNTLAGIIFDNVHLVSGRITDSTIDASITSSVNTPNINIQRVGGSTTDTSSGNLSAGTLRVAIATNDVNSSAQTTSLGLLDNSVDGNYLNTNMNIAGTDVVSGSGTATGALRVELPTNGTGVIATVGAVTAITNPVTVNSHAVTNAGTFLVQENGAALTSLQLIDDTVSTIASATPTKAVSISGTDGTNARTVRVDSSGFIEAYSLGSGGVKLQQGASGDGYALNIGGGVAHDAADSGNPIKIGARATNVEISAVSAANDRSDLVSTLTGKLITQPYSNPENFVSGAITSAMTGTTSTSLIAAPASGLRNYITQITVSNSHASVGTDVIIQDGSGGTTLYTIPAAAVYGGAAITFPTPLRQPTTATAIYCANVTTGASTKVSASGYKGA